MGSVFVTAYVNLVSPGGVETAALMSKLSLLAAVIPAAQIAKHLNIIWAKRRARRLLEKEWERWMSQLRAQKSVSAAISTSGAKEAA
jgi:hypothetical protein